MNVNSLTPHIQLFYSQDPGPRRLLRTRFRRPPQIVDKSSEQPGKKILPSPLGSSPARLYIRLDGRPGVWWWEGGWLRRNWPDLRLCSRLRAPPQVRERVAILCREGGKPGSERSALSEAREPCTAVQRRREQASWSSPDRNHSWEESIAHGPHPAYDPTFQVCVSIVGSIKSRQSCFTFFLPAPPGVQRTREGRGWWPLSGRTVRWSGLCLHPTSSWRDPTAPCLRRSMRSLERARRDRDQRLPSRAARMEAQHQRYLPRALSRRRRRRARTASTSSSGVGRRRRETTCRRRWAPCPPARTSCTRSRWRRLVSPPSSTWDTRASPTWPTRWPRWCWRWWRSANKKCCSTLPAVSSPHSISHFFLAFCFSFIPLIFLHDAFFPAFPLYNSSLSVIFFSMRAQYVRHSSCT